MRISQLRLAALGAVSAIALSGCAYDMYGDPYGNGYGQYGGVSVGIGTGGYYGGGYGGNGGYGGYGSYGYGAPGYGYGAYGDPYGGYGYGGYDPFGWYGDSYYPGVGVYVYDRQRNRRVWNDDQRRYWQGRHNHSQGTVGATGVTGAPTRENWNGWNRSQWRGRSGAEAGVPSGNNAPNWDRGSGEAQVAPLPQAPSRREDRSRGPDGAGRSHERENERPQ